MGKKNKNPQAQKATPKVMEMPQPPQKRQPTLDEIYHNFHTSHTQEANIMEMLYNALIQKLGETTQLQKTIQELQRQLNEIQPNLKKVSNTKEPSQK